MFCRKTILGRFGTVRAGSEDEQPPGTHARRILSDQFPNGLSYHYPELIYFRMTARCVPVFNHFPLKWLMRALDKTVGLLPPIRRLAYYFLVEMRKQQ